MSVRRIYVEKRPEYAVSAKALNGDIRNYLGINSVDAVRVLIRYDIENISDDIYEKAKRTVFSEPPLDFIFEEKFEYNGHVFSVEYLPGQFDQRADSARQCLQLLDESVDAIVHSATTYVIEGNISDAELERIKKHCINPVDSHQTKEEKPDTLIENYEDAKDVAIIDGFTSLDDDGLKDLYNSLSLAMSFEDIVHIQNYFKNDEHRDPSLTEIKVLDTYWSDHCRHTTFSTKLEQIEIEKGYYFNPINDAFLDYKDNFKKLYKDRNDKYICLMDIALMAMKVLKSQGKLDDQEESDEINACSIEIDVDVDGKDERWLLNFKNETHNHPTEIEPFGGAATCLGGAIRDPLSGRTYVYQAMRVTGAADPTVSVDNTLDGKLPQQKIVREAASGYSSYGNQIGLATGLVDEIYHPGFVAKRMEIGAVIAAAPKENVKRLGSDPGDKIILLGGRTGRDGIGGATGSSKAHDTSSTFTCGAEVQKGNPPTERKLQRLFRRKEASLLIKKCNDFGAGGVSVAIGELADGLDINLDLVSKKYEGLDGTELAISESQERMAVVVDPKDVEQFLKYAAEENLEACVVATVTKEPRLVLRWRGDSIVDLSRKFLDTNGATGKADVFVNSPKPEDNYFNKYACEEIRSDIENSDVKSAWLKVLSNLNVCSKKGLVERFDSSIGAGSTLMPFGGKYQLTPTQAMVAKIPVLEGNTNTVSMMSYGYDPYLSSWSPFHGASFAVMDSVAKNVATGGDYKKIRFSFQEYFGKVLNDPKRWGLPFSALLGAYKAQMALGLPAIGGKDSMSGTFNDIDVPPTLCSFAVDTAKADHIISPELKKAGNSLAFFWAKRDEYDLPDYEQRMNLYDLIHKLILNKSIVSAYAIDSYGFAAAISKMAFGNGLGVSVNNNIKPNELFDNCLGSIVCEIDSAMVDEVNKQIQKARMNDYVEFVAKVTDDAKFTYKDCVITIREAKDAWKATLERVFPSVAEDDTDIVTKQSYIENAPYKAKNLCAKPNVFIPVFPGTNCEYDSARAFEKAGASTTIRVFKNNSASDITESIEEFAKCIDNSQIIMFPGGFSAGDEPEGSAKFFANAFRNEKISEAVARLLNDRDGLMLGICNGFQALIKLGLVPYGKITTLDDSSPTLTYNTIGRHVSKMAYTKVVSNKSPWLKLASKDDVYAIPASHGEGRFVCNSTWIEELFENGQVATRYCDLDGNFSMDGEWNINGSYYAIEGITSPDGRVYGKMCHSERIGDGVAVNVFNNQDMKIFESGVEYYK